MIELKFTQRYYQQNLLGARLMCLDKGRFKEELKHLVPGSKFTAVVIGKDGEEAFRKPFQVHWVCEPDAPHYRVYEISPDHNVLMMVWRLRDEK